VRVLYRRLRRSPFFAAIASSRPPSETLTGEEIDARIAELRRNTEARELDESRQKMTQTNSRRAVIGKPDEEAAASCAHAHASDKVIEGNAMN
jgi:hypothetical protein